ncbi:MAG: hypothetical protein HYS43_01560 [Candidatus Liptonbacteria bacterium]|nr:hypothetical protein [Candidatus Liptonbacteria bacterium]
METMRKIAIWILALVVVGGIGRWFFLRNTSAPSTPPAVEQSGPLRQSSSEASPQDAALTAQVVAGTGAFSPQTVTIRKGGSVTWTNAGTASVWPASAMHPTHTVYPGSDIKKCGTAEAGAIFDACRGISTGQTYTFTFPAPGTWKYHNHLNPSMTGTVVVE